MLVDAKEFNIRLSSDDTCKLFFVSNASRVLGDRHKYYDTCAPTNEELAAPPLKLKLNESDAFWNSINFGYKNEEPDEELVAAMKGKSKNWKLIRCCTTLSYEGKGFGFFFVLVNPEAYRLWTASGREILHGDGLNDDKQMGIVWVYTGYGEHDFEIIEYRHKKNGKIKKHSTYKLSTIRERLSAIAYCKNFTHIVIARHLSDYEGDNPNYEHFEIYEENRYS